MLVRLPAILLLVLAGVSCDKAKDLATRTVTAVKEKLAAKGAGNRGVKVDAALQQLVDQTAEGAVFRKDLPFPTRLEVRTTRRLEMNYRYYQESAIAKGTTLVHGTLAETLKLERAGDQVCHTVERSSMIVPAPVNPKDPKKKSNEPVETVAPPVAPVTFRKAGKTWQAEKHGDFRTAVLSQQLSPVFDVLLVDQALAPRPRWFVKRRFKIGDELVVAGDALPMIVAGNAKGSIKIKLESFEAVEGHPCGVFSVTGDFSRSQFPDFEGGFTDQDVTIQAGKLWLSLVYPVILKEELDTIETSKFGGQGGLVKRGQGSVKVALTRAWKRLDP